MTLKDKELKEYEWDLTLPINRTKAFVNAVTPFLQTFTIWEPSQCQIIDYNQYTDMVNNDQIHHASYWRIKKGGYGLISLAYYKQFSNDWNKLRQAYSDFAAGWRAAQGKRYKH